MVELTTPKLPAAEWELKTAPVPEAQLVVVLGGPDLSLLVRLKNSVRNCRLSLLSGPKVVLLRMEKSQF